MAKKPNDDYIAATKTTPDDPAKAVKEFVKNATAQKAAIQASTDAMEAATRAAQKHIQTTEKVAESSIKSADAIQQLSDNAKEQVEKLASVADNLESVSEEQKVYNDLLKLGSKAIKNSSKDITKQTNDFSKNSKAATAAAVALKTFGATIKGLKAIFGGVTGVIGKFVELIWEVGSAIVSAPFMLMESLIGRAKEAMGQGLELATAREEVREIFGDISKGTSKDVINIGRSLATGVIAPGLMARQVFGTFAEALDRIRELAAETPVLFQKLGDQFNNSGLQIMSMASGLGIAKEELAGLQARAVATGEPLTATLSEVTKYAKGLGAQFGINSKAMSRDMGRAMKDVKHFANATVKEVAQATVYAHKLGLELKDITGVLDAFNTFDQAAENVAKLSQAFGVNIDLMKLMEAKTPADALDEIKKAFTAAGKSADQMSRQELQLIAQTTNLSEEQVRQGLSMKNAGVSMDAVKSSASALQAQTMDTGQAITALATDIKRLVKAGQAPEGKSFFEIFLEGFVKGIDLSGEFQKLIQAVMKDIWIVRDAGMKVGQAFVKFFPGFTEFLQGLRAFLDPAKMKSMMSGITSVFIDFFKQLGNGTATFEGLIEALKTKFITFFDNDKGGRLLLGGLTKMWKAVERIISTGLDWLTEKLKTGIQFLVDLLSGKYANELSAAGEGILGGLGAAGKSPIVQSLINAYEQLKDPLGQLFEKVFNLAIDKLGKILSKYKWEIALVTLGPTLASLLMQGMGMALKNPALAAGLAAVAGVGAAVWQGSELIDELKRDYIDQEIMLKTDLAAREVESSSKVLKTLSEQNAALKEKHRLGQITLKQYNSETRSIEAQIKKQRELVKEKLKGVAGITVGEGPSFTSQGVDLALGAAEAVQGLGVIPATVMGGPVGGALAYGQKKLGDQLRGYVSGKFGSAAEMDTRFSQMEKVLDSESSKSLEHQKAAVEALEEQTSELFKNVDVTNVAAVNNITEKLKGAYSRQAEIASKSLAELAEDEDLAGVGDEERVYLKMWAMTQRKKRAAAIREGAEAAALAAGKTVETPAEDADASLDTLGLDVASTTEEITEKLKNVEDLSKKVLSPDFDLSKTMKNVREKLSEIDFSLFKTENKDAQTKQIAESAAALERMSKIPSIFSNLSEAFGQAAISIEKLGEAKDASSVLGRFLLGARKLSTFFDINTEGMFFSKMSTLNTSISASEVMAEATQKNVEPLKLSVNTLATQFDSMKTDFENMQKLPAALGELSTSLDSLFFSNIEALGLLFGPADKELSLASKLSNIADLSEMEVNVASWITDSTTILNSVKDWTGTDGFIGLDEVTKSVISAEDKFSRLFGAMSFIEDHIRGMAELDFAQAVGKMVENINSMNVALSNVNIGKDGQVRVKLAAAADGIMKADQVFNIKKAPININMEVHVELAVSDVEKVILKPGRAVGKLFDDLAGKQTPPLARVGNEFQPKSES